MVERAKTYADRLPPLVPKEEADISHLSDEMADVLYPGRRPRPFRVGLVFEGFEGAAGERAVELARRSGVYRSEEARGRTLHHAAFEVAETRTLRTLFEIVGHRAGTEVRVDGRRWPYGHELWLPLLWFFVDGEA